MARCRLAEKIVRVFAAKDEQQIKDSKTGQERKARNRRGMPDCFMTQPMECELNAATQSRKKKLAVEHCPGRLCGWHYSRRAFPCRQRTSEPRLFSQAKCIPDRMPDKRIWTRRPEQFFLQAWLMPPARNKAASKQEYTHRSPLFGGNACNRQRSGRVSLGCLERHGSRANPRLAQRCRRTA